MLNFDIGKNSPKAAIRRKCLECAGGSQVEVWRCENSGCALWTWRPLRPTPKPRMGEQLSFIELREVKRA